MSKISFQPTFIDNLKVISHKPLNDSRGFFERIFCQMTFDKLIYEKSIQQINLSYTKNIGTVRGLHFQYPPSAEIKIVSCLKGKVWDVAVDLREGSPTFLKYYGEILSENNNKSFLIPEGFAHGFQSLTSDCKMLYLHTATYNKSLEGAINIIDPMIGIDWPIEITDISPRDKLHPLLTKKFKGIKIHDL